LTSFSVGGHAEFTVNFYRNAQNTRLKHQEIAMLQSSYLWLSAFVLFSQVAIAGTDVGYDLNTSALETTPAAQPADNTIRIEDRTWAVPGVEQSINKIDLVDQSGSRWKLAFPHPHSSYCMSGNEAPRPQWISEIAWPLTRELWSDTGLEANLPAPATPIPPIPLRGFHGMNLATAH
jgi:hypothetical protein